jgi:diguanylate cyclase (GGDEF)-like protein
MHEVEEPPADAPADDAARTWRLPSARRSRLTQFRRANIMVGFASSFLIMLANILYFSLTPDQPNRPLLWAIQALAILLGAGTVFVARRWLPMRPMIHLWTASQLVLTAIAVAADGGFGSPLMVVLVTPLVLAAMALPSPAIAVHTAIAIVGLVAAGAVTGTLTPGVGAIWSVNVGAVALIGAGVARNTRRLTGKLEAANRDLLALSRTDSLTGCLNHGAFFEELDLVLARSSRSGAPVSVLLLDLDHFKDVNDTHGHPTGDQVLVAVADALRTGTRAGDVVARTGGEEFAVLMPDTTLQEARQSAERIRTAIAAAGGPVPVTASAGLAAAPDHGGTSTDLVRAADNALYAAKDAGRDRLETVTG